MVRISSRALSRSIAKAVANGVVYNVARRTRSWQEGLLLLLLIGIIGLILYLIHRWNKRKERQNSECKNATQISVAIPCAGSEVSEPSTMKCPSMGKPALATTFAIYPYQSLLNQPAPGTNSSAPSENHNNGAQESATAMVQQSELPPSYTDSVIVQPQSPSRPSVVTLPPPRINQLQDTDHTEQPLRPPRRPRAQNTTITIPAAPTSTIFQPTPAADIS